MDAMNTPTMTEEHKFPVSTPSSAPASPLPAVDGLSLASPSSSQSPALPPPSSPSSSSPSSSLPSSSSPPSLPPPRPLEQWLHDDSVKAHPDNYVKVSVWTSLQVSTTIMYPKSRLSTMGTDSMPDLSMFRAAEARTANARQAFWCGEGGDHMVRFNNGEQHQCHLLFVMWHDFQQLDSSSQQACKSDYIKRTYECLSKARNSTRVIRQLQAFAHFVCDSGETYIEPSKFIDCSTEVTSHRSLFKKMVQKVLAKVKHTEQEHKAAMERPASSPSTRALANTSVDKQRLPKMLAVSIGLCERYSNEVLIEHPLISRVDSADVKDGLPIYTVVIKGEASLSEGYSHDALAIREENLVVLAAYNSDWKKDVGKVGEQIDPLAKKRTFTVTWKGESDSAEVSKRFFELVGWMDYYQMISLSSHDDDEAESAPSTPLRLAPPHSQPSSSSQWSLSSPSSRFSTPVTRGEGTIQQLHELVDNTASKGMSETRLRALYDRFVEAVKKESSIPAMETDKDTGSEMEDDEAKSDGQPAEDEDEEETAQSGGDDDDQEEDGDTGRMDDDYKPIQTRSAKRKAITKPSTSSGTKKRTEPRRA
jgi:hypothetical protein